MRSLVKTYSVVNVLVEMSGLEPPTPCLQSRCSPSWATSPRAATRKTYDGNRIVAFLRARLQSEPREVHQTLIGLKSGKDKAQKPWVFKSLFVHSYNELSGFPPRAELPTGRNRPTASREPTLRRTINVRLLFGT